jgi:16S rRNA (guanine(966)-N(2))-methyltransferase RsmD
LEDVRVRIIAGERRGARLKTLDGEDTRPTMERVKEAIFSSIQFLLPGAAALDLFAGSGQLGLEALSRGAARCTFVDQSWAAAAVIKQNCRETGLFEQSKVLTMDTAAFLLQSREKYDVILADPPYRQGKWPQLLERLAAVAAPGAMVLCETEAGAKMPQQAAQLELKKQYKYGTVMISRYAASSEE